MPRRPRRQLVAGSDIEAGDVSSEANCAALAVFLPPRGLFVRGFEAGSEVRTRGPVLDVLVSVVPARRNFDESPENRGSCVREKVLWDSPVSLGSPYSPEKTCGGGCLYRR